MKTYKAIKASERLPNRPKDHNDELLRFKFNNSLIDNTN